MREPIKLESWATTDERFFKALYNGLMVFVSKFMHWADFNVLSSQLQNFVGPCLGKMPLLRGH